MQPEKRLREDCFVKATVDTSLRVPFFLSLVQAGFPSPADNYVERVCDLNDLCITNAEATFFVRAVGDSIEGDYIQEGDVLVVDCSRDATDGKIVVAWANGGNTIKCIHYVGGPSHGGQLDGYDPSL